MILKEQLADKLNYNPITGLLTWKSGKRAGWINNGYYRIGKLQIYAHQIIIFKMLGYWCEEVDHKDHDGLNNKWENLRSTDRVGNNRNVRASKNNRTGVLHVHKHSNKNGYDVRVGKFFRAFTTDFEQACQWAQEARQKYYGEYA